MLSAASLASRWDCHRDTVYKMIARGDLPCRRIGGMVRIPLEAVEKIEGGEPWRDGAEGTGPNSVEHVELGDSAGLRVVGSEPEAFARAMKRRPTSGLIGSSPNSTSRPAPRSRP